MQDLANDLSRTRIFELDNGNKLYAKQTDPYGFWYLNLDKGQLPDRFKGAYSTWDALKMDVDRYQVIRQNAVTEILQTEKEKKK